MSQWIDATLSPDVDPLDALVSLAESVDFVARLCAAWDFGLSRTRRRSTKSAVMSGEKQSPRVGS